ncbi:MAG: hypothetical protein N2053_01970, partial [Chitinispirillaceae bacterium]|nr:hypothetical protein [Chitinispirillaceae bacterium]
MCDIIKMVVVLTVISSISALLVSFTNSKTEEQIKALEKQTQAEALKQIMPDGVNISENSCVLPSKDTLHYWKGTSESDTFYAFKIQNRGYSSILSFL